MTLSGNTFENNIALLEGGVIKWKEIRPIFINNNTFSNNFAIYGPINAAFPFRINLEYHPTQKKICLEGVNQCYIQLSNIGSGNNLDLKLRFTIKDIYNKTITAVNDQYKKSKHYINMIF